MMVSWNGLGSFTFNMKTTQGDVTLVTNPYTQGGDMKFPRSIAASVVVASHEGNDTDNLEAITPEYPEDKRCPFVVTHAGEFEVRAVAVTGVRAAKKDGTPHTVYRIDAENMSIGFLGALDRPLTDKEAEDLGNIDVLIVPAGGGETMSATTAAEVVAVIEPRLVIPSYAADPSAFCRELSCPKEETTKLKLSRAMLPEEDMKIITLSRG